MSNVDSVRQVYQAFAQGDIPTVLSFLNPEIDWTEAEGFPYAGTYHGPRAVLEGVFMRLGSEWNGFAVATDEFIDAGDTVVVLGKYSGTYKATGKSFQADFAHVWKVQDGKAIRFMQYVDTLLGRGTCPSTGESARRTNAVMDRVLAAYYGGREDAFWTRPIPGPAEHDR